MAQHSMAQHSTEQNKTEQSRVRLGVGGGTNPVQTSLESMAAVDRRVFQGYLEVTFRERKIEASNHQIQRHQARVEQLATRNWLQDRREPKRVIVADGRLSSRVCLCSGCVRVVEIQPKTL